MACNDQKAHVTLNSGRYERSPQPMRPTAARCLMQSGDHVPFLVSSGVCVCHRLLRIAWAENGLMGIVARIHRRTVFVECFVVRSGSLLFHRPALHSRCRRLIGIRNWAATLWNLRVEMDREHYNYWCDRAQLYSGISFRPLSAKWIGMICES